MKRRSDQLAVILRWQRRQTTPLNILQHLDHGLVCPDLAISWQYHSPISFSYQSGRSRIIWPSCLCLANIYTNRLFLWYQCNMWSQNLYGECQFPQYGMFCVFRSERTFRSCGGEEYHYRKVPKSTDSRPWRRHDCASRPIRFTRSYHACPYLQLGMLLILAWGNAGICQFVWCRFLWR